MWPPVRTARAPTGLSREDGAEPERVTSQRHIEVLVEWQPEMPVETNWELPARTAREVVGVLLCVNPGACPYSRMVGADEVAALWRVMRPQEKPRRV